MVIINTQVFIINTGQHRTDCNVINTQVLIINMVIINTQVFIINTGQHRTDCNVINTTSTYNKSSTYNKYGYNKHTSIYNKYWTTQD